MAKRSIKRSRGSQDRSRTRKKVRQAATTQSAAGVSRAITRRHLRSKRPPVYCGFHFDGSRLATLEEVRDPAVATRSIGELSHPELVTLILERLRREKTYPPLRMLGAEKVIDKRRVIQEIRKLSPIGLHLIDIEKEYVKLQVQRR